MTRKKTRTLLLLLAMMLIAALTAGYFMWNKPHKNVEEATAVMVAAPSLYNLFVTDSLKAKNLYTGKIILVSGRVEELSANQQSQNIILLNSGVEGGYINCTMEGKTDNVKEHDSISVKGICSGYISGDADMGLPGDVFVTRGYLLK